MVRDNNPGCRAVLVVVREGKARPADLGLGLGLAEGLEGVAA